MMPPKIASDAVPKTLLGTGRLDVGVFLDYLHLDRSEFTSCKFTSELFPNFQGFFVGFLRFQNSSSTRGPRDLCGWLDRLGGIEKGNIC